MNGRQGLRKIDVDEKLLLEAGIDKNIENRSASFFLNDKNVLLWQSLFKEIELLPLREGLAKFPQYQKYFGLAFKEIDKQIPDSVEEGFFLLVKKGAKLLLPVQVCLLLKSSNFHQKVRNLIIVEESATVYVINGCVSEEAVKESLHLGISEYIIMPKGYLNFTMIHSWGKEVKVTPISSAVVFEEGMFVSNYICLKPVKEIVMYPTCVLKGEKARASFSSIVLSHPDTLQDIGSRVILAAENSSAEIVSRAVSMGGEIIARGHILAKSKFVKAHLECQGLIVSEKGTISAIPQLQTMWRDVDLSHEAAIGKISRDEIEYLASRGISENDARSLIIRGFMDTEILGLPDELKRQIDSLKEKITREAL